VAHPPELRAAVRRSFVVERLSLEAAAEKHGVAFATVRSWKAKGKETGDDWDRARQAARMVVGGLGDLTTQVLEDFALLFQFTMEELQDNKIPAIVRAEAIAKLADAYTKTVKAAGGGDGKLAKLSVALEVLERFVEYLRTRYPQHAPALLEVLEPFGEELSRLYG